MTVKIRIETFETDSKWRSAAAERVRRVLDDRSGFDTSSLDKETRDELLADIVNAVIE